MEFPRSFSVTVVALLAGAAAGYCLRGTPEAPSDASDAAAPQAVAHIADKGGEASLESLRARIRSLEAELAAARRTPAEVLSPQSVTQAVARVGDWLAGEGPREALERLKAENPERYAQMTNHFERFRRMRQDRANRKLDFLSSVDVSRFSKEGRETHERLLSALARREELSEKAMSPDLASDERREVWAEMRENEGALRRLCDDERDNLLAETATTLGLEGDVVGDFVETVKGVFDATSSHGGGHHFGGGPGGPRHGRGGFDPPPGGRP